MTRRLTGTLVLGSVIIDIQPNAVIVRDPENQLVELSQRHTIHNKVVDLIEEMRYVADAVLNLSRPM